MHNENQTKLLNQLKKNIDLLRAQLPTEAPLVYESIELSRAVILRESCLHRITELAEAAHEAFLKNQLIAAFTLCRALMETEALFIIFIDKLHESLKTQNLNGIHIFLNKSLLGVKDPQIKQLKRPNPAITDIDPINVLTLIGKIDKKIKGYSLHYASLSEFTHPNAAGTSKAYAKIDYENNIVRFGIHEGNLSADLALPMLTNSLHTFIDLYDHSADLLQEFTALCNSLTPQTHANNFQNATP